MPEVQKTGEGKVQKTWNPWKMFDISSEEFELMKKRKDLAALKRVEFRMLTQNPAEIVNGGTGGHVFDPVNQRWFSGRATYGDHFRVNRKNTIFVFGTFILPVALLYSAIYWDWTTREAKNRRGEIAMKDKCNRAWLFG